MIECYSCGYEIDEDDNEFECPYCGETTWARDTTGAKTAEPSTHGQAMSGNVKTAETKASPRKEEWYHITTMTMTSSALRMTSTVRTAYPTSTRDGLENTMDKLTDTVGANASLTFFY